MSCAHRDGAGPGSDRVGRLGEPEISIVIPVLNEKAVIPALLSQLEPLRERCEILFVDGGSSDGTREAILEAGFRAIVAPRGRGSQLNAGARASGGKVLFFLHADSVLPPDPLGEIRQVMRRFRVGCFGVRFAPSSPLMFCCRVLSNFRCYVRRIMFGDQGIFIERDLFFEMGGFPDLALMEDYQFSLDLRAKGHRPGATRHRITTSSRRYGTTAVSRMKAMVLMCRLRKLYREGAPIDEIARIYGEAR